MLGSAIGDKVRTAREGQALRLRQRALELQLKSAIGAGKT
jgi:hypothetical protein